MEFTVPANIPDQRQESTASGSDRSPMEGVDPSSTAQLSAIVRMLSKGLVISGGQSKLILSLSEVIVAVYSPATAVAEERVETTSSYASSSSLSELTVRLSHLE